MMCDIIQRILQKDNRILRFSSFPHIRMMFLKVLIWITITYPSVFGYQGFEKFSKAYFKEKYIDQVVVFTCWDFDLNGEIFNWKKSSYDMKISYIRIEDNLNLLSILKVNYYKLGVVLDFDCPKSDIIFHQFSQNMLPYNESYFWMIITGLDKIPIDMLAKLPLTIATEMTMAIYKNDTFETYDVYNPSLRHGGHLNITYMGYWKKEIGLKNDLIQYKYKRRQNLNGLTLNFSIFLNYPALPDLETYLTTPTDRHLDTMIRFHYALVLKLKDFYNFTIKMHHAETWGYLINGSFNGVLGDMVKGTIDMGAAPFRLKIERLDVCEFTVQVFVARPCFIFRHPKTNELRNVFLKPFTSEVWYYVLVVAFIYWSILYLTVKIELNRNNPRTNTLDTNPATETILITTASVCQQGLSDGPRSFSGRITFLSLFLWGLLLFQFYSASIVGSLLSEPPRFINTLKDLTDSNLDVGLDDIAYNYDYLRLTTDPVAHELSRKKIQVNAVRKKEPYLTAREGLKKVQKGGYAFHVDVATAYKIIEDTFSEDELCDLCEVQLLPPQHTATITSRHSPFKKMITYALRQVSERGMVNRLRSVWHHRRPQCPENHNSIPAPVALKAFSPALFSLFMGAAFAVLVVLMETFMERLNQRKQNK